MKRLGATSCWKERSRCGLHKALLLCSSILFNIRIASNALYWILCYGFAQSENYYTFYYNICFIVRKIEIGKFWYSIYLKKKAQLLLNFFEFSLNIYRFSINVIELITIKYYRTIKNLIKIHSLLILWIIVITR